MAWAPPQGTRPDEGASNGIRLVHVKHVSYDDERHANEVRTVHIAASMEAEAGGPPRVVAGIANALVQHDCSSTVLATHRGEGKPRYVPTDCPTVSLPRCRPRFWYKANGLEQALKIHARDADLLHLHEVWSYPQFLGARYGSGSSLPYVLTPHGELGPKHMRNKGPLHHLKKRVYLQSVGRRVVFGAACLHVFTEAEAEGLQGIGYRGPVTIVPNGIDFSEFASLPDPNEADEQWPELAGRRVVLFMSRLSPEKGLSRLIPAWREIVRRDSFSDALLVLAGPSDRGYGETVRNLIAAHNVSDHVLQTGLVTGSNRLKLLARADVYTLPSFSEGFSMSLLEAMACGNVTVFTPGCNFPEAEMARAGICVNPQVHELREALVTCIEMDSESRHAMGDAAKQLVQDGYTWDVVAAKMRTVYQAVVDGEEIPRLPGPFWRTASSHRRAA